MTTQIEVGRERRRLGSLFAPRGVVVVGASRDPRKLGAAMTRSLSRFPGTVAGVNPRDVDPDARRYASVTDAAQALDAPLDLAVLCVPAAGDAGVALLGPNTSGFIAPAHALTASFVPGAAEVPAGPIAVVTASGGVNHACADAASPGVRLAIRSARRARRAARAGRRETARRDRRHKTDIGGVRLDVRSRADLDSALDALESVGAERFLVESMAPPGVEIIVGATRDPVFGPVVLVGMGGVVAEVLADVATAPAPLSADEAADLLDELAARPLLDGLRGTPVVDRPGVGRILAALGDLLAAYDQLESIEINPLRITADGPVALDAVVTIAHTPVTP